MAHNKLYRNFIILQEDEKAQQTSGDKALSGYAKIEAKNDKCKISFYAQNLKVEEKYSIVLICYKKDMKQIVDLGSLTVKDSGKGEVCKEYYINNIGGVNLSCEKISGAAVCKHKEGKIDYLMYGFMNGEHIKDDWKKCKVVKHNAGDEIIKVDKKDEAKKTEAKKTEVKKKEEKDSNKLEECKEKKSKEEQSSCEKEKKEEKNKGKEEYSSCKKEEKKKDKEEHHSYEKEKQDKCSSCEKGYKEEKKKEDYSICEKHKEDYKCPVCNEEEYKKDHKMESEVKDCEDYCDMREKIQADFDAYESRIEKEKEINPYDFDIRGEVGEFFSGVSKGFEEVKNKIKEIKYCKWYKIKIKSIEDMCNNSDYSKYTVAYYPMINYFPYIKKYGYYMLGFKCDNKGEVKYLVYGIPGKKNKDDQPFMGKTGFVTWMKTGDGDMGCWLMFYDFKKSTVVIPMK